MNNIIEVLLRSIAAVVIGTLIGSERMRHGRAAGMRTHILVCLGACMTSMTSMFVSDALGNNGDVFRIPAQVVSGIGFLGAGMIILKSNNMITGLTTAAGVWATATIGVALGYGFYVGAVIVTLLFLATIILFAKFERKRKSAEVIYIEIDDLYKVNAVLSRLREVIPESFTYQIFAPKSEKNGNIGMNIVIDKRIDFDISSLCDIENIAYAIAQILEEQKWQVTMAYDGQEGLDLALSGYYDVAILDIMLPVMNGFEVVQKMRANKIETPTLLLSALDEIPDKVKGLNVGADDYMTKPFSAAELVARINALTRRKGEVIVHELKYDDLSLQLDTCELYCASQHIHLGYKEFEIMKHLMSHPEMITSKDDLIVSVWGSESDAMDNNVEVYISFLRKKLKFLKSKVSIKVIRKVGYRLEVCDA